MLIWYSFYYVFFFFFFNDTATTEIYTLSLHDALPILLGLLEDRPKHGYELRRSFDERFSAGRPLRSGQVYSTLGRLRSGEHTSELQSRQYLVCRLLL